MPLIKNQKEKRKMLSTEPQLTRPQDDPEYAKGFAWMHNATVKLAEVKAKKSEMEVKRLDTKRVQANFDSIVDVPWTLPSELDRREEWRQLEEHERSLEQAIEENKPKLDAILARISLRALEPDRAENVKDMVEMFKAIKVICDCTERVWRRRANRQAQGFETGSVPSCEFPGAIWPEDDPYGSGTFTGHYRYILNAYPEVKKAIEKLS
jgi:hypothetical protein